MNRRDTLLALLALGVASAPLRLSAQPAPRAKPFRIGLLPGFNEGYRKWIAGEMGKIGWIEGRDFVFVYSVLEYSPDQIEEDARRMVAENPDLILTNTGAYALHVQKLTTTIPIVIWAGGDPVLEGLANSLARPGKNVTGTSHFAGHGLHGKLLELLRDAKPGIKRIGVLWDYVPPFVSPEAAEPWLQETRRAARALGITLHIAEVPFPDRLPAALAEIEAARPDGLFSTSGPSTFRWRQRIAQFAVEKRLPLIADFSWTSAFTVDAYPMITYGPSRTDLMRSAVSYVDRILKGEKAGDLPFQQPMKFELAVNLKTAKAIGLTLPQLLLLRADVVVE